MTLARTHALVHGKTLKRVGACLGAPTVTRRSQRTLPPMGVCPSTSTSMSNRLTPNPKPYFSPKVTLVTDAQIVTCHNCDRGVVVS